MAGSNDECNFEELSALLDEDSGEAFGAQETNTTEADFDDSDDDIDEDELDRLLALAEADQQEQQVQVKTEQDKMEDHARRDTKSLAKPEEQTMTNEAKTDKAAVDGGQLAILEEMRKMQERIKELESQLVKKEPSPTSLKAPVEQKPSSTSQSSASSGVVPSRKWTKTPVRPLPAAAPTAQSSPRRPSKNNSKPSAGSNKKTDVVGDILGSMGAAEMTQQSSEKSKPRKLKDVDINVLFEQSPSEKSGPRVDSRRGSLKAPPGEKEQTPTASQLFGDSDDSDWDGMDGEQSGSLSGYGKEINSLIKRGQRERVAHTAHYESSSPAVESSFRPQLTNPNKASTSGRAAQRVSGATSSNSVSKAKLSQEENNFAPMTHIRIVKPLVPLASVRARMASRKVIALSRLHLKTKSTEVLEGDWITVGVIITKSEPKMSSKGKQFSIWTLCDLEDCDTVVKMFLFGETHAQLWRTPYGAVIGVLNASIMASDKYQNSSTEVSFTVDKPEKVMVMGQARDLGVCKGRTKAGKDCRNAINKEKGDYCTYHVQAAYKKAGSKRAELQNGFNGVVPRSFEKKLFKKSSDTVFYGGDSFSSSGGASVAQKRNKVSLKSIAQHQSHLAGSKATTATLHKLLPEDEQKLKTLQQNRTLEREKAFQELLTAPSVGSMNLVKHLVQQEVKQEKKGSSVLGGAPRPKKVESITASQFLKMHKQQNNAGPSKVAARSGLLSKPPMLTPPPPPPDAPPQIGRGLRPGTSVDLDFDLDAPSSQPLLVKPQKLDAILAKKKAVAKLQVEGRVLKKENPNSVRKKLTSPESREKIRKRVAEDTEPAGADEPEKELRAPKKKKSRLLGDLDLDSEEVQKLLKKKSKHEGQLDEVEQERLEAYFDVLEKKEKMEEKMASVKEKEVTVVTCIDCSYTAYKALDSCKQAQHELRTHKAKQRFFNCKNCSNRTTTIDKYPQQACTQCGGSSFERTSMLREKKGPKLPQEELLLRGEERKWVNS